MPCQVKHPFCRSASSAARTSNGSDYSLSFKRRPHDAQTRMIRRASEPFSAIRKAGLDHRSFPKRAGKLVLLPIHAGIWMPAMMPHQGHANGSRDFSIDKMIWKACQVGPVNTGRKRMKAAWVGACDRDGAPQLHPEIIGQSLGNGPVAPHRLRYVLPDGGVILNTHYLKSPSTSRQNSASVRA